MALEVKDLAKLKWYYQVLLVAAICGIGLFAVWNWILSPLQAEVDGKKAQVSQLQGVVAKSEARQKELAKIKKETIELQARLETLKAILPLEKETDQILRAVRLQATASGLRVLRVAPRATVEKEAYTEFPFDLEVTGTYHTVGAFLDRIRQLPRIVNISGLRLQGRASEGEQAFTSSVGATYTATTFVYKEEPPPPPPPAK
jgi:type IV pilus assembly protein PilO